MNRTEASYIINGFREQDLHIRAAPVPGLVQIELFDHGNRRGEPVVLTAAQCEALAQSLAMALYSG